MSTAQKWTSRKRVSAAIKHEEPDRIPISFGGTWSTGILECPPHGRTYTQLCEYLRLENYERPNTSSVSNHVKNIDERIKQKFGSDLRIIDVNTDHIEVKIEPDGTKTSLFGMRIKKMGYYDDIFEFPLRNCTSKKDIEQYLFWPTAEDLVLLGREKENEQKVLRKIKILL